ncbi:pectate lyase family protein [Coprobacter sp.]
MKNKILLLFVTFAFVYTASAQITIKRTAGWHESAYITWDLYPGADMYNVYVKELSASVWTQLDKELIRNYGYYGRADMVGLKVGNYQFKVEATQSGNVISESSVISDAVVVTAHDRGGFAHKDGIAVGAYNNDGTLKNNARVLYVTNDNFNTVSLDVTGATSNPCVGLGIILNGYQKGQETRPLAVRFIGNITNADASQLLSDVKGLQLKGKSNNVATQVTLEGIGDDATVTHFGFAIINANNVEVRNLGFMLFNDDGISIKGANKVWVHNCDIFYGKAGSASDQAKGDGSLDVKDNTQYSTFSYVHFWDSGKMSLCGMKKESGPNYLTYHHNWFDHSDSRHPRIRTMTVHVYNNYYDGNAKYGVGATFGSSVFVESNYYRGINRPMMSSKQGTDASGDGTFSGENGGMIKSYGNVFVETGSNFSYITANEVKNSSATFVSATDFDAYQASARDESVPTTYKTLSGGTIYNNFDTDASLMYSYVPDDALNVPAKVKANAGRMYGGDFSWEGFNNMIDDSDYEVNTKLMNAIRSYNTSLLEVASFIKTAVTPVTYTVTYYNDVEGTVVFASMNGQSKVVYPENIPVKEGYAFVGWNIPQGKALTSDISVYPAFSDGSNSVGGGSGETVVNKWIFTSWSAETQVAVSNTLSGWTKLSDGTNRYDKSFTTASSLDFSETESITFSGNVRISFDSSKGKYFQGTFTMNIPVTAGQKVSISFSNTGSSNGSRNLLIDNEIVASSSNTSKVKAEYTVPAGKTSIAITGSGSLNYYDITITEEIPSLPKPDFAYSVETFTADMVAVQNIYPVLTNESDGQVTYSSSNPAVATVDADGTVTLVGLGISVIRATVSATEVYSSAATQYRLTVIDSSIPTYIVTFMCDDEIYEVMERQSVVRYPAENPEKDGCIFSGWDVAEGTILSSALTVNAIWSSTPTYKVIFVIDGEIYQEMEEQTKVVYPITPKKDGYIFGGWSVAENTPLTGELTVTGSWKEIASGTVVLESGQFPAGYTLNGASGGTEYTYSSDTKAAKLFTLAAGTHTVAVPEGMKVISVAITACAQNNENTKAKLTEFNGVAEDFSFSGRKTLPFKTILFDNQNIMESFTFKVNYAVGVRIVLEVSNSASSGVDNTFTTERSIHYDGSSVKGNGRIDVYSIGGSLIMSNENIIDMAGLSKGFYIVRCGKDVLKIRR